MAATQSGCRAGLLGSIPPPAQRLQPSRWFRGGAAMTSPEPTPTHHATHDLARAAEPTTPARPSDAANAPCSASYRDRALDHLRLRAVRRTRSRLHDLISAAMGRHGTGVRERRCSGRSATLRCPPPAISFQWRSTTRPRGNWPCGWKRRRRRVAAVSSSADEQDRAFAVTALTQCASPLHDGAGSSDLTDHRRFPGVPNNR